MTDIPANHFFGQAVSADPPRTTSPFPPEISVEFTPQDLLQLQDLWPDLSAKEQERVLHDLQRLTELRTEIQTREEELQRRKQLLKNQGLIRLLQDWRAEEAQLSSDERTKLTAEWEQLEQLLHTERV